MKLIKGDLFKNLKKGDILIHNCNTQKNFGKGFAYQIKKRFKGTYKVDCDGTPKLGEYSQWTNGEIIVVNIYGQIWYGQPYEKNARNGNKSDTTQARYKAIAQALFNLKIEYPNGNFVMPKIGAGLCGLSWEKIKGIIQNTLGDNVTVYYL